LPGVILWQKGVGLTAVVASALLPGIASKVSRTAATNR